MKGSNGVIFVPILFMDMVDGNKQTLSSVQLGTFLGETSLAKVRLGAFFWEVHNWRECEVCASPM